MSKVRLRSYQEQALDAEDAYRAEHPDENRLVIEMATGLGKTITFAERARRFLEGEVRERSLNRRPVLILVHTDELVRQAVEKVRLLCGDAWSVGVVKADRNEVNADIVVASVATLIQPGRKEQISDVGYIIVDECHHAVAASYVEILRRFGGMEVHQYDEGPLVPVLGVTATLKRTDGQGFGHVWHNVVFSRSTTWGQRKGYLIDLVPYTIRIPELDASASDSRLDDMLINSMAPEAVVEAWMRNLDWGPFANHREKSTVLFAPLVASAQAFAAAFQDAGVKAEVVHGAMPKAERKAVLDRYEAGVTTVLCNAMVLTEGWDSPRTMCVIVARPTKSVPLFIQMVGRGLRPWLSSGAPPREDQRCVLLCVADTTTTLATYADLSDNPLPAGQEGKSLLAMEDEWDIGKGIEDPEHSYSGPIVVERWDAAVQASSKAWKYTNAGAPFLPTAKKRRGYVFVVETARGWEIWGREPAPLGGGTRSMLIQVAPDLELAMALAEDEAQERGGDVGALLADKTRAWRKAVPSVEMTGMARAVGVPEKEIGRILTSKASGKAGKLSDLIDKVVASRTLDPIVRKIKERASV
jgi:superfamily II DNA or RNA helicase